MRVPGRSARSTRATPFRVPPVPYPVQFRVTGADPKIVRDWADKAKDILRAHPDMRGVNDNWNENVKILRLHVDQLLPLRLLSLYG